MVDAPEKIWAHYSPDFGIVSAYDVEMPSNLLTWHTEYTRSDIAAELAAENERLRKALKEIANLSERPYDKFPSDWRDQIAACPECQRYKDHPIQRGICDDHRKPLYDRDDHYKSEKSVLGYRAKSIAREALAARRALEGGNDD